MSVKHLTSLSCPHCHGPARVRSSRAVTSTYRQLHVVCLDPECGHTFAAELTVTHTISPSARPDPSVRLRIAPPRRRTVPAPANDDHAPTATRGPEVPLRAANDDGPISEAI